MSPGSQGEEGNEQDDFCEGRGGHGDNRGEEVGGRGKEVRAVICMKTHVFLLLIGLECQRKNTQRPNALIAAYITTRLDTQVVH